MSVSSGSPSNIARNDHQCKNSTLAKSMPYVAKNAEKIRLASCVFLSSKKRSNVLIEKSPTMGYVKGGALAGYAPIQVLSFGVLDPSDGLFESTAFFPRDVQNVGFVGKAVD